MPENTIVKNTRGLEEEQVLATKVLRIQNKRFYLDVRQNKRGRFVKITEVGNGGQKSRILMSIPVALEVEERIAKLNDIYSQLPAHNRESMAPDGRIAHAIIARDSRRYYLDLKENDRGRFLRLAMMSMGIRVHITIPADSIGELKTSLGELIEGYADDAENDLFADLPKSKVLFTGNKTFYFDVGSNRFGVFLRISEVRASLRSCVTIPVKYCDGFRDIIAEFADKVAALKVTNNVQENGDNADKTNDLPKANKEDHAADVVITAAAAAAAATASTTPSDATSTQPVKTEE